MKQIMFRMKTIIKFQKKIDSSDFDVIYIEPSLSDLNSGTHTIANIMSGKRKCRQIICTHIINL